MTKPTIEEQLFKAIDALSFYADVDTYFAISVFADRPCGEFADDFTLIQELNEAGEVVYERERPGKRARETLRALLDDPQVCAIIEHWGQEEVTLDESSTETV